MGRQTTSLAQRGAFYTRHQHGETYSTIAAQCGVSRECVRDWCRRQRDGGDAHSRYQRAGGVALSRFDPKVRYVILRLRLTHPHWGPGVIRVKLSQRPKALGGG